MDTVVRPLDTVRVVGTPPAPEGGLVVQPVAFTAPLVFVRRGVFSTSYTGVFPAEKRLLPDRKRHVQLIDLQSKTVTPVTVRVHRVATERLGAISRGIGLEAPIVSGTTGDVLGAASDFPGVAASVGSLVPLAADSIGLSSILKYSSVNAVPIGAIDVYHASRSIRRADNINDTEGRLFGAIGTLRGGIEIAGGVIIGAIRTVTIASHFSGTTAKTLATASKALGTASTVVSSIGLALFIIPSIIKIIKGISFLNAINQSSVEDSFAALRQRLDLSDGEIAALAASLRLRTASELYDLVKDPVVITKEHAAILSAQDKSKIEAVIDALPLPSADLITDRAAVRAHLVARLQRSCAEKKLSKEAAYLRYAGPKSLAALKEGQEPVQVVVLAKKEAIKNLVLNIAIVLTAVIALIGFILTTIFTGGAPLIIGLALLLVVNIASLALDLYFLKQNLEVLKGATWLDKALLATFLLLTIASVVTGAIFSAGILPLVLVLIGGGISIAVQTGALSYSLLAHKSSSSTAVDGKDARLCSIKSRRPRRSLRYLPHTFLRKYTERNGLQGPHPPIPLL